jgi:serine/threonine protein kinase
MASKQELVLMALAVKQGILNKDQVQTCMDLQNVLEQNGQSLPLVQIALKKKFLTPEQVDALSGKAPAASVDIPQDDHISLEQASRIPIFDVHEEIGQGGMATVFLATDKETKQRCALKVLFPKHTTNKVFVERFLREGKLLKEFECENIAQGYRYGVVGKDSAAPLYFMSMEYIEGRSIQDMLDKEGPFPETKAIYAITEAARGLAYMQERGYVHRDVKPDNVMWNNDGRVMLVDLGFSTPIRADLKGQYLDETCGTVQYISPEQAKGQADLDIRADIYSMGATLYHMVMGKLPFGGNDSMEIMAKQVMENLDAAMLKGGKISMHMHYFIEKMMAKDRDIRYQSAREIVDDIGEVLSGAADLQYNPQEDPGNPFTLLGKSVPISSGRLTKAPGMSGRMSPSPNTSVRMRPSGESVKTGIPKGNTAVIRKPLAGTGASNRAPAPNGTQAPGSATVKNVTPTPQHRPGSNTSQIQKAAIKPGASVRMPQSPTKAPPTQIRLPEKRKPN